MRYATRLIARLAALSGLVALSMLTPAAASAADSWHINGSTLGAGEEATFVSSGTFTIRIPGRNTTFTCAEKGSGSISGAAQVSRSMELYNCVLVGLESQCHVQPTSLETSGPVGGQKPIGEYLNLVVTGELCTWWEETIFKLSNFSSETGTEKQALPVYTTGTSTYGAYAVYLENTSKWELTGKDAGRTFGFYDPEESGPTPAWHVYGKWLSGSRSIGTQASGSIEIAVPTRNVRIACESGIVGSVVASGSLEYTVNQIKNCLAYNFTSGAKLKYCTVVFGKSELPFSGEGSSVTYGGGSWTLKLENELCPIEGEYSIAGVSTLGLSYGQKEAVQMPVSGEATGTFGAFGMTMTVSHTVVITDGGAPPFGWY